MQTRLPLNFGSFCLYILSVGITALYDSAALSCTSFLFGFVLETGSVYIILALLELLELCRLRLVLNSQRCSILCLLRPGLKACAPRPRKFVFCFLNYTFLFVPHPEVRIQLVEVNFFLPPNSPGDQTQLGLVACTHWLITCKFLSGHMLLVFFSI